MGRRKYLWVDGGTCRHISRGPYFGRRDRRCEALRIAPRHLPEPLRRAPDGAEPPDALAQVRLAVGDAYRDDLIVAAASGGRS
jgi:hypothetical protein